MPDIPDIPIPFIGRVIAVIKDVIVRLRNVSPVSSAMTFFQGKRNETFPERFTIVS